MRDRNEMPTPDDQISYFSLISESESLTPSLPCQFWHHAECERSRDSGEMHLEVKC